MYEVFEQLLQERNVTAYAVSKATGVPQSTLSDWKKGKSVPKLDKLTLIADFFNVPVSYFIRKSDSNAEIMPTANIYEIPVFESASAGFGAYASNAVVGRMPLYFKSKSEADKSICVKVSGDSMYPKIEDGDTVVIQKTDVVDSGSLAVVMVDDEGLVKKIEYNHQGITLHSINPMYPPVSYKGNDALRVRIVGKVTKIIKDV